MRRVLLLIPFLMLLSQCASHIPAMDMPAVLPQSRDLTFVITPLNTDTAQNLYGEDHLDGKPATWRRIFHTFINRYASVFPKLPVSISDTLSDHSDLWLNLNAPQLSRNSQRLKTLIEPFDGTDGICLVTIDTLSIERINHGFWFGLGRVLLLTDNQAPEYMVRVSGWLLDYSREAQPLRFHFVQTENNDQMETRFRDRVAFTLRDTAEAFVLYLRQYRQGR